MSHEHAGPILNPRRSHRYLLRCLVRAEAAGRPFASETEDFCLHGCQLVAPTPLGRGTPVRLVLAFPSLAEALRVSGLVAWTSPLAPWRHGVAFGSTDLPASARWLARLITIHPELSAGPRAPGKLEPETRLFLGQPPRLLLDFTAAELAVLRQVQGGIAAGELRRRLAAAWEPAQRALFSLLARRAVVLEQADASHPLAWTEPLGTLERELSPEATPSTLGRPNARAAPVVAGG